MSSPLEQEYESRRAKALADVAHWQNHQLRYRQSLVMLLIILLFAARVTNAHANWIIAGSVFALGILAIVMMLRARDHVTQAQRRVDFYIAGLARLRDESTQTGFTGEAFAEDNHLYARDLNILGADSLFGMLATTRTTLGQRALAAFLLHAVDAKEANARQCAVRELAAMTDLRERIGLLGRYRFEDLPAESLEAWLDTKTHLPQWPRAVLASLSALWIALSFAGWRLHWSGQVILLSISAAFAVQALICRGMRSAVLRELEAAKPLAGHTEILREGVATLRSLHLQAPLLQLLQQRSEGEDRALARLQRGLMLVEQRDKDVLYILGLSLCMGTHTAILLQRWKQQHGADMRRWLQAWSDFDALIAIATYTAEHEANTFPTIADPNPTNIALFTARALAHPLLPRAAAIPNDITLHTETRFLLISGSNMAGKSTLLRAIGTNVVLALAGASVPAEELTMSALTTGASIAIVDSLAEGKSKFLAEVERLKAMTLLARDNPGRMLFLIDEVLSGTNSADRKAAAESVLRSLIDAGAIGAMSTHDLTLTTLAEIDILHGRNVHMASPIEDDPLAFDYLLKDGRNRTTNAMAIVKMLGLA
jgi:hypothetical protein